MQIKKRYIKEEIERRSIQYKDYLVLVNKYAGSLEIDAQPYRNKLEYLAGQIDALEWVLGFADD